ncbi:MAG TPA: hypothetical protein VGL06_31205 [Pseudonocardiaceae bacterium]
MTEFRLPETSAVDGATSSHACLFATAPVAPPGYHPGWALIDGDSVTTDANMVTVLGIPISEEMYLAEKAGYIPFVVTGSTWDSMTAAQFADYQLLRFRAVLRSDHAVRGAPARCRSCIASPAC